jgi:hypothetical protein
MRPRIHHFIAIALVLVVGHAAFDQAGAKVVHDGKGAPANPAIEMGGLHVPAGPSAQFPYSLVGAIANQNRQVGACDVWSWRSSDRFALHRRSRMMARRFEAARFSRFHPPVK